MAEYVRKLVSGGKARFRDPNLNLELDLVYITDQVIIMGYPAAGMEGLYRNRREDAKKFLEHRHGKNYWIFNFCPIRENSYDKAYFDGRVSRYPFPDHHAPPLAIMPLLAREMRTWLSGSSDRISVLHCKAGKGRSGTMACTYLLSLEEEPTPPKLASRHLNAKEWAEMRAREIMQVIPEDENEVKGNAGSETSSVNILPKSDAEGQPVRSDSPTTISRSITSAPSKTFSNSLKNVLDLHSAQRMKQSSGSSGDSDSKSKADPSAKSKKAKLGVSIPSQRRWLNYWSLVLGNEAPAHFWKMPPPDGSKQLPSPRVRIQEIKVRMKEASQMKYGLVKVVNMALERAAAKKKAKDANPSGKNQFEKGVEVTPVWASLARYDDEFVDTLESWERHTRVGEGADMGKTKHGSDHMDDKALKEIFDEPQKSGKWDSSKMVRSFSRMGLDVGAKYEKTKDSDGKTIYVYPLRALTARGWQTVKEELEGNDVAEERIGEDLEQANIPGSENASFVDVTATAAEGAKGVVVDAAREVRVKLYYGQVFMGWCWFIPTFHMPHPPPTKSSSPTSPVKFLLTRKDLDFPLGIGKDILDVEVTMEWVPLEDKVAPPARAESDPEAELGVDAAQSKAGAALQAAVQGNGVEESIRQAAEAGQAAEN